MNMGKTVRRADLSEIGGKLEAVVKMLKLEMTFRQLQGDFVQAVVYTHMGFRSENQAAGVTNWKMVLKVMNSGQVLKG